MNGRFRSKSKKRNPLEAPSSDTLPQIPDGSTVGDANLSDTDYARKRKQLLELTKELRAMGAETLIALPRIAVIGGQSAGKSSLVEAVSGINVPRDSGTCTRCPTECTMSSDAQTWSCQISLRFEHDEHARGASLVSKEAISFGPPITSKSEVEIRLRQAQAAILSGNPSYSAFAQMSAEHLRELIKSDRDVVKFSRNIIVVDIYDPDATELSFVDLPGLIQYESEDMISRVRGLVESYISEERTIILVTIPASDDLQNQQAFSLAEAADPDGARTIGVLTKSDTLTAGATGARESWKNVLEGKKDQLKHGYYCVRLSDDAERARNVSRSEAQQIAAQFFNQVAPWSEVEDRTRFGIPSFVSNISKLLMDVIEKALPQLRVEVTKRLASCERHMTQLPKPLTTDPTNEVLARVTAFSSELRSAVNGEGNNKGFVQQNRASYLRFKGDIRGTAPDFRPFANYSQYGRPLTPDGSRDGAPQVGREHVQRYKTMDLEDVRQVIKESTGWELPHHVPYDAQLTLMKKFIALWQAPAEECFESVFATLAGLVDTLVHKHFERFKHLEASMRSLVAGHLSNCKGQAFQSLHDALGLEEHPIFTQNTHYLESTRLKWLAHYKNVKNSPSQYTRWDNAMESPDDEYNAYADYAEPTPAPRAIKVIPPETFTPELQVMAEVRAYFQVSYKRVIDHIPLTIERSLNRTIADSLQASVIRDIGIGSADAAERMKVLVSEDPALELQREQLRIEKNRLVEIQRKLGTFWV
ncbi:hypothetical protein JAAARDRAFT_206926 [Jaapia argillacea MUCL 33604]|uniref:GED domain-containing protein n=1 Tax=Jaapia argillacea MUCL 33604 TaxID=933084 RepID=A0A067PU53_9AGAM|nr:hypothetical protein JAAARDRAFT_206926 [Jaapia argillacea MUCL 33604]